MPDRPRASGRNLRKSHPLLSETGKVGNLCHIPRVRLSRALYSGLNGFEDQVRAGDVERGFRLVDPLDRLVGSDRTRERFEWPA